MFWTLGRASRADKLYEGANPLAATADRCGSGGRDAVSSLRGRGMGLLGSIGKLGVADALTIGNGLCGVAAIVLLLREGRLHPWHADITLGSALILLGFVLDGADGWAARRWGTKHDLGRHLDSISDAITFCAAPAVMVSVVFHDATHSTWGPEVYFNSLVLLTSASMLVLGIVRLHRFTTKGYRLPHFTGLATPAMAFLAILVCHILGPQRWEDFETRPAIAAVLIMLAASLLMVAPVRYPKLRGRAGVVFAAGVLLGLVSIGVMRASGAEGTSAAFRALSLSALGLVLAYVLLGPVWMAMREMRSTESSDAN